MKEKKVIKGWMANFKYEPKALWTENFIPPTEEYIPPKISYWNGKEWINVSNTIFK